MNRGEWPKLRKFLADGFRSKTRDYWAKVFQGTDSCAVPVLLPSEAARLTSGEVPVPHPSLSRTYPWEAAERASRPLPLSTWEQTEGILDEFGIVASEKAALVAGGALGAKRSKL